MSNRLYVYTDGACTNNGKKDAKAGVGVFFATNDSRNLSARLKGKQTNNRAEIVAILMVYKILRNEIKRKVPITIFSDSQYAIRCATDYGKKMEAKNFQNIPNSDLVKKIYTLYKDKDNIEFRHIKAHTNKNDIHSFGNREADRLAVLSIQEG